LEGQENARQDGKVNSIEDGRDLKA